MGHRRNQVHSNVFYKGIKEFSVHDILLPIPDGDITKHHVYTLDWKKDSLTWLIDGKPNRTLLRLNSTSPMVFI